MPADNEGGVDFGPLPDVDAGHAMAAQKHFERVEKRAIAELGAWGTLTLFRKELHRFFSFSGQSLISPALTTVLWYLVFGYSIGDRLEQVNGIPYTDFLIPGLVIMAVTMNAFMNSAFSFFITKIHGVIVDLLVTPLHPWQIILSYTAGSMVRGILVGGVVWAVAAMMGANTVHQIGWTLVFLTLTSAAFALLGLIAGVLAKDFDQVNFVPSFILMPMTFLGGVFYSISMLPPPWDKISLFNPIVYMVNGLRYGMTGHTEVALLPGLAIATATVVAGYLVLILLIRSGKGIKV